MIVVHFSNCPTCRSNLSMVTFPLEDHVKEVEQNGNSDSGEEEIISEDDSDRVCEADVVHNQPNQNGFCLFYLFLI